MPRPFMPFKVHCLSCTAVKEWCCQKTDRWKYQLRDPEVGLKGGAERCVPGIYRPLLDDSNAWAGLQVIFL